MSDTPFFMGFAIVLALFFGFFGFLIGSNYSLETALEQKTCEFIEPEPAPLNLSECIAYVDEASYDMFLLRQHIENRRALE